MESLLCSLRPNCPFSMVDKIIDGSCVLDNVNAQQNNSMSSLHFKEKDILNDLHSEPSKEVAIPTSTPNESLGQNSGCPWLSNASGLILSDVDCVLRCLMSCSTFEIGFSHENIYGELGRQSLRALMDKLRNDFMMDSLSIFLDVGSGRGLPSITAALYGGVQAALGVEIEQNVYHLGQQALGKALWILLERLMLRNVDVSVGPCALPVAFLREDVCLLRSFEPTTHIYSFDLAMPSEVVNCIVSLFNRSPSAQVYCTFRKDLTSFGINAEVVDSIPVRMLGSGEGHRIFFFVKRSFLCELPNHVLDKYISQQRLPMQNTNRMSSLMKQFAKSSFARRIITAIDKGQRQIDLLRWRHHFFAAAETPWLCYDCKLLHEIPPARVDFFNPDAMHPPFNPDAMHAPTKNSATQTENTALMDIAGGDSLNTATGGVRSKGTTRNPRGGQHPCVGTSSTPLQRTPLMMKRDLRQILKNRINFEVGNWLQCEACGKWRRIRATEKEFREVSKLDYWECQQNVWDPSRASCTMPEEGVTTNELALGDMIDKELQKRKLEIDCASQSTSQVKRRRTSSNDNGTLVDESCGCKNPHEALANSGVVTTKPVHPASEEAVCTERKPEKLPTAVVLPEDHLEQRSTEAEPPEQVCWSGSSSYGPNSCDTDRRPQKPLVTSVSNSAAPTTTGTSETNEMEVIEENGVQEPRDPIPVGGAEGRTTLVVVDGRFAVEDDAEGALEDIPLPSSMDTSRKKSALLAGSLIRKKWCLERLRERYGLQATLITQSTKGDESYYKILVPELNKRPRIRVPLSEMGPCDCCICEENNFRFRYHAKELFPGDIGSTTEKMRSALEEVTPNNGYSLEEAVDSIGNEKQVEILEMLLDEYTSKQVLTCFVNPNTHTELRKLLMLSSVVDLQLLKHNAQRSLLDVLHDAELEVGSWLLAPPEVSGYRQDPRKVCKDLARQVLRTIMALNMHRLWHLQDIIRASLQQSAKVCNCQ